jgi:hypothetical protein
MPFRCFEEFSIWYSKIRYNYLTNAITTQRSPVAQSVSALQFGPITFARLLHGFESPSFPVAIVFSFLIFIISFLSFLFPFSWFYLLSILFFLCIFLSFIIFCLFLSFVSCFFFLFFFPILSVFRFFLFLTFLFYFIFVFVYFILGFADS